MKAMALVVALMVVSTTAWAHPCKGTRLARATAAVDYCDSKCNPDGRTSITLTGSMGNLDGLAGSNSSDLTAVGIALVYPATNNFSLLAGFNHSETEWDVAPRYLSNWDTDVFTVGVRFYLGK